MPDEKEKPMVHHILISKTRTNEIMRRSNLSKKDFMKRTDQSFKAYYEEQKICGGKFYKKELKKLFQWTKSIIFY